MGLTPLEQFAIGLSLKISLCSVCVVVPAAVLTAHLLTRFDFRGKVLLETLFLFPLILPPVVTGYLLLLAVNRNSWLGDMIFRLFEIEIAFAFPGAVLAAAVVSFPLVLRPVKVSMEAVDPHYIYVSRSLGVGRIGTFFRIIVPMTLPGVLAGALLGFARSFGEFGATIMLAGNIPFETTTLPLAIFSFFNRVDGREATVRLVIISVIICFISLVVSEYIVRRKGRA